MVNKDQVEELVNAYTNHLLINPTLCSEVMYREQYRNIIKDLLELVDKETRLSVSPYSY